MFQVVLSGGMRQLVARFLADAFAADSEASPTPTAEMLRSGEGLPGLADYMYLRGGDTSNLMYQ